MTIPMENLDGNKSITALSQLDEEQQQLSLMNE